MESLQRDRQSTDDRQSEKLTWAFIPLRWANMIRRNRIFGCKLYVLSDIFINNTALCGRSFKAFCITAWDIFYIPLQHKYKVANTTVWIGADYTLQNTPVHSTAQRQWQQKWIQWWCLWSQKCVSDRDNLNPTKEEKCNK